MTYPQFTDPYATERLTAEIRDRIGPPDVPIEHPRYLCRTPLCLHAPARPDGLCPVHLDDDRRRRRDTA